MAYIKASEEQAEQARVDLLFIRDHLRKSGRAGWIEVSEFLLSRGLDRSPKVLSKIARGGETSTVFTHALRAIVEAIPTSVKQQSNGVTEHLKRAYGHGEKMLTEIKKASDAAPIATCIGLETIAHRLRKSLDEYIGAMIEGK